MSVNTQLPEFKKLLQPGDFIVQPYGYRWSSARFNGIHYDTIRVFDTNVFERTSAFVHCFCIDENIHVYRKAEKREENNERSVPKGKPIKKRERSVENAPH